MAQASGSASTQASTPASIPAPATAPPPAPRAEPRFEIRRFEVAGAKLIGVQRIDAVLAPLTGPGRRFSDIEAAVQAVRDVYEHAGITAMQVLIPEQDLNEGVVRLQVEELQVAGIEIAGAKARSHANILRAVPGLREGSTPVDTALASELRLANENPGRQMQVTFRTEDDGSLTGVLRVADRGSLSAQLSADNTGSATTGQWRVAGALQHSNLLDRDIVGSLQVQTSPGYEQEVRIGSASLRLPLYPLGWMVDASVVHSSVDSGTVKTSAGDYLLSSVGSSASLRLSRLLPRWGALEQRISIGQDWRHVDSQVTSTAGGTSLVPDIVLRPVTLSYSASWKDEAQTRAVFGSLSWSQNQPGPGRSAAAVFAEPGLRAEANPRYTIVRAALGGSMALGPLALSVNWNGQWTEDALVAAEQFGIGGEGSIRGFNGRVASGDLGHRLGLELQSDMKALKVGPTQGLSWGWQAFAEAGEVRRNRAQPSEKVRTTLSGAGAGVRLAWRGQTSLRADAGVVAKGDGIATDGDHFVHVSLSHAF
jgi:hemolysin activation/secretion protein